jgi:surface protein
MLTSIDVSKFNIKNIKSMREIFNNCKSLEKLYLSNFDTSEVTDIYNIYNMYFTLSSLDLKKINPEKVKNIDEYFILEKIYVI